MPERKDNEEEQIARIAALVEEYRVKHEDLESYIRATRKRAEQSNRQAKSRLERARRRRKPTG
ncbi:MAG TPA: hypothetical protein VH583_25980 [Vicinamibacterales bacterium]|jgi:hypothetical protein